MKEKKFLLLLLSLVVLLGGCTSSGYQPDINRVEEEILPLAENESAITRTNISVDEDMESIVENRERYGISVHYPVLHHTKIDQAMKDKVYQWICDFEDLMDKQEDSGKGELSITYSINRPTSGLASIEFSSLVTPSLGSPGKKTIHVLNVDLEKDRVLTLEDVFKSSPLPVIGKALTNWFELSSDFKHKLDEPKLKTTVETAALGDGTYKLGENTFQVIFQEDSLLDRDHRPVVVDIPYNNFANLLREEYIGLKDILAPIDDDTYIVTDTLPSPYVAQRYKSQCKNRGIDISSIDPEKPMIALTFDDGPNDTSTLRVMETLERYKVRGTFFVLGSKVEAHPEVIRRMAEGQHEIGNHTYSHASLIGLDEKGLKDELDRTANLVYQNSGYDVSFIRPTYGAVDDDLRARVDQGLIMWSVDTMDWKTRDADAIYREIMKNPKDGDIILMHDIYDATAEAVERAIPELMAQGFQLVTVSDLFNLRGVPLEAGKQYFHNHRVELAEAE